MRGEHHDHQRPTSRIRSPPPSPLACEIPVMSVGRTMSLKQTSTLSVSTLGVPTTTGLSRFESQTRVPKSDACAISQSSNLRCSVRTSFFDCSWPFGPTRSLPVVLDVAPRPLRTYREVVRYRASALGEHCMHIFRSTANVRCHIMPMRTMGQATFTLYWQYSIHSIVFDLSGPIWQWPESAAPVIIASMSHRRAIPAHGPTG